MLLSLFSLFSFRWSSPSRNNLNGFPFWLRFFVASYKVRQEHHQQYNSGDDRQRCAPSNWDNPAASKPEDKGVDCVGRSLDFVRFHFDHHRLMSAK